MLRGLSSLGAHLSPQAATQSSTVAVEAAQAAGPSGRSNSSEPSIRPQEGSSTPGWAEDALDTLQATADAAPGLEQQPASTSARDHLRLAMAGGISGAVSKTAVAPLARLTILYQVRSLPAAGPASTPAVASSTPGMLKALRDIVRHEGLHSLWRGNLVTIIHRVPYSATNFWAFETAKRQLEGSLPNDVVRRFVAGAFSGLVACSAAYPLDLLRTRLAAQVQLRADPAPPSELRVPPLTHGAAQAAGSRAMRLSQSWLEQQRSARYRGVVQGLGRIAREEGLLGLYRGLGATLMQVVPTLALNFTFYDSLRALASPHGEPPSAGASLACASVAGLATSTLTFPLDVVRRRMQVAGQGEARAGLRYLDAWGHIWRQGGLRALYVGIVPEYCKVLPGMAIAFTTYEALRSALKV